MSSPRVSTPGNFRNLPADWARAWENLKKAKSQFEEELLKTEKETMSDASASKTEVRPSPELSQPIDVEVEKTADSKPEDK